VNTTLLYKRVVAAPNPGGFYKRLMGNGWTVRAEYYYSEYSPALGKDHAGRGPDMYLDVHGNPDAAKTIIIFFHPGCLTWGNRSAANGCVIRSLLDRGHAVVSVDYRLTGWGWNGSSLLEDVHDSIDFAARTWPQAKLVIWGESGGAQLALLGAYTSNPSLNRVVSYGHSKVVGVVADSPQIDMRLAKSCREGFCATAYDDQSDPCWEMLSPLTHVNNGSVPTLLVSGLRDTMTKQEQPQLMANALKASGVRHLWVQSPHSAHVIAGNTIYSLNYQVFLSVFHSLINDVSR